MAARVGPGYAARMGRRIVLAVAVLAAAVLPGVAKADASWYPHPADATWTYQWSPPPMKDRLLMLQQAG